MATKSKVIEYETLEELNLDLLEFTGSYVNELRSGKVTWREFYNQVRSEVLEQQPNPR